MARPTAARLSELARLSSIHAKATQTMSTPSPVRIEPVSPPVVNDLTAQCAASKIGTPLRTLALCLASIAVMAPWPLLGILLTRSSFDHASEAFVLSAASPCSPS